MPSEIISIKYESKALKSNPLKDPYKRELLVYLPPSYFKSKKRFPVAYLIAGFTGYGRMNLNESPFSETIKDRLDRLIKSKTIKQMIFVMPDCMTKYGGSQYVNSTATGRYEDYIIKEIVPFIDKNFRTIAKANSRCIIGKSSGGYGAMWLSMRYPQVFGLMVTHSGDSAFEYCYMRDFPDFVVNIQKYGQGHNAVRNFIQTELNKKQPKPSSFHDILNMVGMSACYSPNPKRKEYNFDLPFDIYTGELIPSVWKKWLTFDPVQLVGKYKSNLKKLKLIFIDCGTRDQFKLFTGSRIFSRRLKENNIKHVYQEFNDTHMNIQYRYDVSFKYISQHISFK